MPQGTSTKGSTRLTIMDAALRLRFSYDVVRRMVLVGELEGGKGEGGRWYVEASSVEAFRRNSAPETAAS